MNDPTRRQPRTHNEGAAPAAPRPTFPHRMGLRALGAVTITPRALAALMRQSVSPVTLLRRHCWGDWGQLTAADRRTNADAVRNQGRVCSRYRLRTGLILYVITEGAPGQRRTTILTPDDD